MGNKPPTDKKGKARLPAHNELEEIESNGDINNNNDNEYKEDKESEDYDNEDIRQSTSALVGDLDPYPRVFQIPNAIPGSVQVSATGWLRATSHILMGSQVLMGPQVLESTYKYSWY